MGMMKSHHTTRPQVICSNLGADMYIFLDIDGVLVTPRSMKRYSDEKLKDPPAEERAVKALNLLCDIVHDPKIVVSSSWRRDVGGLSRMKEYLKSQGVKLSPVAITPFIQGEDRGLEIQTFLDLYPDTYIVIDDDYDYGPLIVEDVGTRIKHWIRTDPLWGFHIHDIMAARQGPFATIMDVVDMVALTSGDGYRSDTSLCRQIATLMHIWEHELIVNPTAIYFMEGETEKYALHFERDLYTIRYRGHNNINITSSDQLMILVKRWENKKTKRN